MKKTLRKVMALMLILTLSISSVVPALAAENVTLKMRSLSSYYKNHHNVLNFGEFDNSITVFQIGNEYAFCTQAGRGIRDANGNPYVPGTPTWDSSYDIETVTKDNSLTSKIAYLGFMQYKDDPSVWNSQTTRDWYYGMTQMMMWQSMPSSDRTANGKDASGNYRSYFLNSSLASEYASFKQRVQKKIDTWSTRPSFDLTTQNINAGETVTLTDTKGVLEDYNTFTYTKNGITVSHTKGNNTLTVTANKDCTQTRVKISDEELKPAGGEKYSTKAKVNYVYSVENSQNLAVYGYTDPVGLALNFNVNIITGKIAIEKTKSPDAANDETTAEQGAEFEIYLKSAGSYANAPAEYRDKIVTGADGKAITKDLPHETYRVHQTKGAAGHKFIEDFDVVIGTDTDGKVYTYKLNNDTIKSKVQIVKKDKETGKTIPIAGTTYEIKNYNTGKKLQGTFKTDGSGVINLKDPLAYGEYLLTELSAPTGYVKGDPIKFTIDGKNDTVVVEQFDSPQKGIIKINKTGSIFSGVKQENGTYTPMYKEGGLQGVTFDIKAAEDIRTPEGSIRIKKGTVVDTVTTDAKGQATSKPQYLGQFDIVEKSTVNGFLKDPNPHRVELKYAGQEVSVTDETISLNNERQKVKISLGKSIEEDETFGIEAANAYKDIKFGLFADKDTVAADGSKIPKDGLIEKVGLTETDGQFTSAFAKDIPHSSYYVKELESATGYVLTDTKYPVDFTQTSGNTALVKISLNGGKPIENKLIRGDIEGHKSTDDGTNLSGALIGLFRDNEKNFTKENAIMTTTSANDGSFSFAKIPYGKYIVREIKAPSGCVLNETSYKVNIDKDKKVVNIEMENKLQRGTIKLHKEGEILYHIEKRGDEYTPKFKTGGVEGAVFEIRAAEDIKTPDGVLRYKKGDLVDTVTTDKDGNAESKKLFIGKYTVKEVKAPYGHVLDTKTYAAELKYQGQKEDVTGDMLDLTNTRQKVNITLTKFIEEDELFGIKASDTYRDIKFGLFADKEIVAADGTKIPKGGLVETIGVTESENQGETETGEVTGKLYEGAFTKDLPHGTFYVQETKTNEQYILDDTKYPVNFEYADQTLKTVDISANEGTKIDNELIRGELKGLKTGDEGKKMEGAVFGLFDKNEKEFTEDRALMVKASGSDGIFSFTNLPYGKYLLKELEAPADYICSPEVYEVNISGNGEVVEMSMENMKKPPKTGDKNDLGLWLVVALSALMGGIIGMKKEEA